MTRRSKIARLPLAIRQQLNQRLADGEPGKRLLQWLNALPEVKAVLAGDFDGQPITEPNLSRWREGAFQDWLAQEKSLEAVDRLTEDAAELSDSNGALAERMALVLTARLTAGLRRFDASDTAPDKLCAQLVALRRGNHFARFLDLQAQRLEFDRQKTQPEMEKQFLEWAKLPENQAKFCPGVLSLEEQRRRARKILEIWDATEDLPPETKAPPPEGQNPEPGNENPNQVALDCT